MKIKITVTKTDIRKGTKPECDIWSNSCPIYQAFKRQCIKIKSVLQNSIKFTGSHKHFGLPQKAVHFISRFDSNKQVKPFSFEMDIPKKYFYRKIK